MNTSFYKPDELGSIGLKKYGDNVLISRNANFYSPEKISVGSNVRIDDFCILSGRVDIGNYVHIASSVTLIGGEDGIVIEDFAGISHKATVLAVSDDFSGGSMTGPMVPIKYRNVSHGTVLLKKHSLLGVGSTVMPNVIVEYGTAIGAMSFVVRKTKPWSVYFGVPARKLSERKRDLLKLEKQFMGME
ncbi:MAG: acyltransferase [Phycisphaerae bacterium]